MRVVKRVVGRCAKSSWVVVPLGTIEEGLVGIWVEGRLGWKVLVALRGVWECRLLLGWLGNYLLLLELVINHLLVALLLLTHLLTHLFLKCGNFLLKSFLHSFLNNAADYGSEMDGYCLQILQLSFLLVRQTKFLLFFLNWHIYLLWRLDLLLNWLLNYLLFRNSDWHFNFGLLLWTFLTLGRSNNLWLLDLIG